MITLSSKRMTSYTDSKLLLMMQNAKSLVESYMLFSRVTIIEHSRGRILAEFNVVCSPVLQREVLIASAVNRLDLLPKPCLSLEAGLALL